jgi:hypothetical protein
MIFVGERPALVLGGSILTIVWLFWPYSVAVQLNVSTDSVTLREGASGFGTVSGLHRLKHAVLIIGILSGLAAMILAFCSDSSSGVDRVIITLFALSYFVCLHYMTKLAARMLLTWEGRQDASSNHLNAACWHFLFSPIGLWWLQPRLNAVFAQIRDMHNLKATGRSGRRFP